MIGYVVLIFFAFRSCNQAPQGPPPNLDASFKALQHDNEYVLEASAQKEFSTVESEIGKKEDAIQAQLKAKTITEAEANTQEQLLLQKRIEGATLVADAFLRAGAMTDSYGKYQSAYMFFNNYELKYSQDPAWNTVVYQLPKSSTTAADLYARVVNEASTRAKTNRVLGFIPGYQLVEMLVRLTGSNPAFSYTVAMLLLAIIVRLAVWPVTRKQIKFSRQMAQLSPLVKEIGEAYKNDSVTKQQKTMELYREYGINPTAGCLPILIQAPFFIVIYDCALLYRFEFQKGVFMWINPITALHTNGWTAPNLGQQDKILVMIYAVSLVVSTYLNPVSDPSAAKQQRWMMVFASLIFPVFMLTGSYTIPSAFVLYWTFTNMIATAQLLHEYRTPAPKLVKVATAFGGAIAGAQTGRKAGFMERMNRMMEEQYNLNEQRKKNVSAATELAASDAEATQAKKASKNGKPPEPINETKTPKKKKAK